MKKSIVISLLLTSLNAFAGIISQEVSFGQQGSTTDVPIGSLNQVLSISAFDTTLGTLTDVNITVSAQMDNDGSSQNQSIADGRADIGIFVYQNWQVTTNVAIDHVFRAASFGLPFLIDSSAPLGTFNLVTGTSSDTFTYNLSTGELNAVLQGVDISAFTLGNDIDFNFTGFVQTNITNNVDSGTGYFLNSFQTGSWGKVSVEYVYEEEGLTPIPEPSTLAILGLGLMGLCSRRKKFKT